MKKSLLFGLIFLFATTILAQQVTTVAVHSKAMNRDIDNTVVLPADYDQAKTYPVVYLLHGHGGNHKTWAGHTKKNLIEDATKFGMIFVCPDGQNSWYWDSPIDPKMQFETYVSKELVPYIDSKYSTQQSPKGRAITGFSMGGHGGLWLGINHPDVFGACGSMSGGVDIRPFPNSWNMKDRLGKRNENRERWDDYTVANQLYKIEPNTLQIIIDCGYDDFFYKVNEELHSEMVYMNIAHDYITRPGGHTHEYWSNSLDYQLVFFGKFFTKE